MTDTTKSKIPFAARKTLKILKCGILKGLEGNILLLWSQKVFEYGDMETLYFDFQDNYQ